jgi:putative ABC transport system substrate-binding protein
MRLSRRAFAVSVAGLAVDCGCGLWPQRAQPIPRIGFVYPSPLDARATSRADAFRAGLQDQGYAENHNIHIEWRFSTSQTGDDIPAIVAELVALPVDVLATATTPPTQAAKEATHTIPVIGIYVGDPVATGLVNNLARPGANVTALSAFNPELSGKRLDLLRGLVPGIRRIGFVYNQANAANLLNLNELRATGDLLGVDVRAIPLRTLDDLEAGVLDAMRIRIEALVIAATSAIPISELFTRSSALGLRLGLPTMGPDRGLPDSGGLISVGVDVLTVYRRAGYYVDRILKGSRAADLPVEQPTTFEVVLNRATGQALGLVIPPEVAAQVTEWVQ